MTELNGAGEAERPGLLAGKITRDHREAERIATDIRLLRKKMVAEDGKIDPQQMHMSLL